MQQLTSGSLSVLSIVTHEHRHMSRRTHIYPRLYMFVYGEDGHVDMPHSFFAHMHAYLYVCAPLYAQKLRRSINLHMHEGTDGYGGSHRRQCMYSETNEKQRTAFPLRQGCELNRKYC